MFKKSGNGNLEKKILIFQGTEALKKLLIFWEMEFFSPPREKFLYFRNGNPEKTFYIFSKESFSYILEKGNPKKIYFRKQKR